MNQRSLAMVSKWILVVAGLSKGYEGLAGTDLINTVAGSLSMAVDIVIGVAALYLAYVLLTKPKK